MSQIKGSIAERMVLCPMINPKVAYRRFIRCQACDFHGGVREVSPENKENGFPAQHAVQCRFPREVLVQNLIDEES